MTTNMVLRGETAPFRKYEENSEQAIRLSQQRSLFADQFEPTYMELARIKRLYAANSGSGTAKVPVAALPTTAAAWGLYNPAGSGRMLVVLQASCFSISGTIVEGMALILGMSATKPTAPTAFTNSVNNPIVPGSQTAAGIFAGGVTIVAPTWSVHAAKSNISAISVGNGLKANLYGMYVVEPGHMLSGSVLGVVGAGSPRFGFGFIWAELDLDMI